MILTGKEIAECVTGEIDRAVQTQPNGFDFTVKKIMGFMSDSIGSIDFDNTRRHLPLLGEIPFSKMYGVRLHRGAYVVEFNERIEIPLDCIGRMQPRSTLLREGSTINCGIWDAGFKGTSQVLLIVGNVAGLRVYENARIGQMVMERIDGGDVAEGYNGIYQDSHILKPSDCTEFIEATKEKFGLP